MKPLVIYHDHCTDGFGAAFAAWLKFGDAADYLPMNYGKDVEKWFADSFCSDEVVSTLDAREVYIVDFSLPREQMEYLMKHAAKVIWLDHHKTAFEMWCGKYDTGMRYTTEDVSTVFGDKVLIRLDDNKSGALLAWEYFHPDKDVPMVIQCIDDRDRWQFKLDGSKEVHAALATYKPWTFEKWKAMFIVDGSTPFDWVFVNSVIYPRLLAAGSAILRAQDAHVVSMAKQARKCSIGLPNGAGGYLTSVEGLAVNSMMHQSEVGHELANASGTYGLIWYVGSDNKVRVSLRSNGDYDVSAIARSFGGGGHRNAAGFETTIETLMGWLR